MRAHLDSTRRSRWYPIDYLLNVSVQSINTLSNARGGARPRPADPDFAKLLKYLRRVQDSGAVGLRVDPDQDKKGGGGLIMTFPIKPVLPEIQAERDDIVAIQTRSGMQILRELSSFIQVPEQHQREHRVFPAAMVPPDGQEAPSPLIQILSDTSKPADAFVSIHYNDLWFWIDNRDLRSKATLTFMLILMTLADTGEKAPSPLLTIQAN